MTEAEQSENLQNNMHWVKAVEILTKHTKFHYHTKFCRRESGRRRWKQFGRDETRKRCCASEGDREHLQNSIACKMELLIAEELEHDKR
jgi:hypothetical protein